LTDWRRSFESRDVCEEIIRKFHGQPIGEEGLLLQVRYADTPAQKDLKRITTERRQFRTNEYNVGAYGSSGAEAIALSPPLSVPSPMLPRASQIAHHLPSRLSGSWKRDNSIRYAIPFHNEVTLIPNRIYSSNGSAPVFKDLAHQAVKVSFAEPNAGKPE
jgi:hypothetical protein